MSISSAVVLGVSKDCHVWNIMNWNGNVFTLELNAVKNMDYMEKVFK